LKILVGKIDLGARMITTNTFTWTSNFNITFQDNEIIELVDGLELLGSSIRVGYPIDIIWDNEFAGINPADGRVMWYDADGEITYTRSSSDQKMMGKYSPDFYGGLTNMFTYKNVSLRAFFQYEYGRSTYNSSLGYRMHAVSSERGLVNRVANRCLAEAGRYDGSSPSLFLKFIPWQQQPHSFFCFN
jgi:TonB-dependent starch-binding outer membrane protein SusC